MNLATSRRCTDASPSGDGCVVGRDASQPRARARWLSRSGAGSARREAKVPKLRNVREEGEIAVMQSAGSAKRGRAVRRRARDEERRAQSAEQKKSSNREVRAFSQLARQRPTLPHSNPCSTIGSEKLDFRVRNGIGYGLLDVATGKRWAPELTNMLIRATRSRVCVAFSREIATTAPGLRV